MAVDESKRKELRGALIRLFLGWVVALVLVELVVTSVESLLLAPWLGATVRVDYALGDSFGFLGALRWAFAAVWQVFFVNGVGSLSVTNRGIALFILGMMVVLVVAPVVAAALSLRGRPKSSCRTSSRRATTSSGMPTSGATS